MTPGQSADVWATYYACRTYAEVLGRPVPDLDALRALAARGAARSGGLELGARQRRSPTCGPATTARWPGAPRPATGRRAVGHGRRSSRWLRGPQGSDGGFAFAPARAACAWAAFRAVHALRRARRPPARRRRRCAAGWTPAGCRAAATSAGPATARPTCGPASRSSARSRRSAASPLPGGRRAGDRGLRAAAASCPGSGFTYRDPDAAGDSLATAAGLLVAPSGDHDPRPLAAWLRAAQLPYEDGVMYMPGRGAEVRCTLWAAAALNRSDDGLDGARLRARGSRELQNPDGGFGYWHRPRIGPRLDGLAAVEIAQIARPALPRRRSTPTPRARSSTACRRRDGYGPATRRRGDAERHRAGGARAGTAWRVATGRDRPPPAAQRAAPACSAATRRGRARCPTSLSTYQAVLTQQRPRAACRPPAVGRLLRPGRRVGGGLRLEPAEPPTAAARWPTAWARC